MWEGRTLTPLTTNIPFVTQYECLYSLVGTWDFEIGTGRTQISGGHSELQEVCV